MSLWCQSDWINTAFLVNYKGIGIEYAIIAPVTPYIDGGDLHQLWKNTGCFDVELTKIYVGELALAIGNFVEYIKNIRNSQ